MKKFLIFISVYFLLFMQLFAQYQAGVRVEKLLQTDTTVIGQKLLYPLTSHAEVTMAKVLIPVGAQTGWHKHDIPVFALVQKGILTVELEDGRKMVYATNATISEVLGVYHNGYNLGTEEVELLTIYLGEKQKPLSTKK